MSKDASSEGTAHGAELVSGYISLSVKYRSAMQTIGNDLKAVETQAAESGKRSGVVMGKELEVGVTHGVRGASKKAVAELEIAERDLSKKGAQVGSRVALATVGAIESGFVRLGEVGKKGGQLLASGLGATLGHTKKGAEAAGKSIEEMGEKGSESIASILPLGGLLAGALGAITPTGAIAAISIGAVVAAFGELVEVGSEWGKISHKLSFTTGLNGDELKQMTGLIGIIGTEIPASFEHIAEIVGDVTKNLHLSGDALKTVTEQVTVLGEKSGTPVDIEGLGMLKRSLGADGPALSALLDQLYTASQRSGVQVNSMIGAISRAAPLLKQFGLDAGESATLLTQFDEAGVDVNKVVPGLARAFKTSAKEGEPFQQFVSESVEQLKKLVDEGDKVGAEALAQKLFGSGVRGGGASILTAIENGKLDLGELGKPDGPQQSILESGKKNEGMGDRFTMLKNQIELLIKPYGETLMKNIRGWFDKAETWITANAPRIVKNLAHQFTDVRHALDNFGHAMGNVHHAWDNVWHAGENVMHAWDNVWHAGENVGHAWDNVWHAGENVGHAWDNVWHAGENVGHAWDNVWHAGENVGHAWDNVWHAGENVWHAFENVEHAIDNVKHAFEVAGKFLINLPGKILDSFSNLGSLIANKVGSVFGSFHFANGGFLPSAATIQKPSGAAGLVQWAEKSTGGEAFIPLALGKRARSLDIWAQTGRLLGAFDKGGVKPGDGGSGMTDPNTGQAADFNLFGMAYNLLKKMGLFADGGFSGVFDKGGVKPGDGGSGATDPNTGQAADFNLFGMAYNLLKKMGLFADGGFRSFSGGGYTPHSGDRNSTNYLPIDEDRQAWWLSRKDWNAHKLWQYSGGRPNRDKAMRQRGVGHDQIGVGPKGFEPRLFPGGNPIWDQRKTFDDGGINGPITPDGMPEYFWQGGKLIEAGSGEVAFIPGGARGLRGGIPEGATPGVGKNGERGYFTANSEKVQAATDSITALQDELKGLEEKRDHAKKALTADKREELDHEIERKHHELDRAEERLQKAEQGDFHKAPKEKGAKGKGGKDDDDRFDALGDIFSKGLTESFLPPGFINPMDTSLARSGGALLSFFGALLTGKGGGAIHALRGGFKPEAYSPEAGEPGEAPGELGASGITPGGSHLPPIGLPNVKSLANLASSMTSAPGANGANLGDIHNHYGPDYTGATIGHDPQEHQQSVRNDQQAVKRADASTQRYGFVV